MKKAIKDFIKYMNHTWDKKVDVEIVEQLDKPIPPKEWAIFRMLELYGPMSRPELVKVLRMPSSTMYDCLIKLELRKLVNKRLEQRNRTGRKTVLWNAIADRKV